MFPNYFQIHTHTWYCSKVISEDDSYFHGFNDFFTVNLVTKLFAQKTKFLFYYAKSSH